ncbi:MAG: hypothetical protein MJZ68_10180, partial [archaeon]|nr:hypothetical protein [archaeon]
MAEKEKTKELERMLSNPRSAILSMTAPLFVAFIIANLQLFIDSYWCTGLGSSAMAAITVSGPVYWVVTDVGAGLGVGVSTAVARALGAENKARADSLASQMIVFTVILSVLTSVIMFLAAGPLLHYMSDSPDIGLCMEYVMPNLIFSFPLILNGILIATLRAEGAAKRSMTVSLAASVINLALDPVFIYGFGWGIGGAALATCVSYTVTT